MPTPQAVAGAPQTARPKFDRKLVIRRETKGRGGKTVTRISGLPAAQRESLAALMKKKLGCGAVAEGEDVLLLGDLVDRAADCLIAEGASRIVKGN
jgi:translation initiation factor 1